MLVYGKRVVFDIATKKKDIVKEVFLSKELQKKDFSILASLNKKITKVDNKKAQAMARGGNHQGVFLEIEDVELTDISYIKECEKILVLVNVTDMGNIASSIRSAYALGFSAVVVTELNSLNVQDLVRLSSSALLDMPLILYKDSLNLVDMLRKQDFKNFGTSLNDSKNLSEINFNGKISLFFGNESLGLSKKILSKMDENIKIEMKGDFDSLNVSVATSIVMYKVMNG